MELPQNTLKQINFTPAQFKGYEYKPNKYNAELMRQAFSDYDARREKVFQQHNAITQSFQEASKLVHDDENTRRAMREYENYTTNNLNKAIASGNYHLALDTSQKAAYDIFHNRWMTSLQKASKDYDDWEKDVKTRAKEGKINDIDLRMTLQNNPFTFTSNYINDDVEKGVDYDKEIDANAVPTIYDSWGAEQAAILAFKLQNPSSYESSSGHTYSDQHGYREGSSREEVNEETLRKNTEVLVSNPAEYGALMQSYKNAKQRCEELLAQGTPDDDPELRRLKSWLYNEKGEIGDEITFAFNQTKQYLKSMSYSKTGYNRVDTDKPDKTDNSSDTSDQFGDSLHETDQAPGKSVEQKTKSSDNFKKVVDEIGKIFTN